MSANPHSDLQNGPGSQPGNATNSLASWLFAVLVGLIGTWQFHIVQFASNFDLFPGDRGDARLVTFLLEHWYRAFTGRGSWLSPTMFYPAKGVIGYADLLIGYAVPFSFLRMFGMGMFEAAEATVILFNFVNYLVCLVLLKKVLRFNVFAAIAGAAFFAFNSPKAVQLGHLQLQPLWFLPLAIIFLVLLVQKAGSLNQKQAFAFLSLAALSLDIQLLTGFYQGWFFLFWSFLFLVLLFLYRNTRTFLIALIKRFWLAFAAGLCVFVLGLVPFLVAYVPVILSTRPRQYEEAKALIPVLWSFMAMGERNYVWGRLAEVLQRSHPLHPELQIGIGLIPLLGWLVLTVSALWLIRKDWQRSYPSKEQLKSFRIPAHLPRIFVALLVLATTLFFIIGLRFGNDHSAWFYVYSFVPGAQGVRAVARYAIMLCLPMAIAFAYAIDQATKKIQTQKDQKLRLGLTAALFLIVGFGVFEQFASKKPFNGFSVKAENKYLAMQAANLPKNCSSFYVAVGPFASHNQFEYHIDAALISVMTGIPTLNGYSGQTPIGWNFWEVKAPNYEDHVQRWIEDNHLSGNVCRFVIDGLPTTKAFDEAGRFVRRQYLDLLGREPDPTGFEDGVRKLSGCVSELDANCDRAYIIGGILSSGEFRDRSYFVYRLYEATLGRLPRYDEFMADRQSIVESKNEAEELASKDKLIKEWVARADFMALYGALPDTEFVDKLLATAGVAMPNRDELIKELAGGQKTRAEIVRTVVESPEVSGKYYDRAFVAMLFFGMLHRDSQPEEFGRWLKTLEAKGDYRQVINEFINTNEYSRRLEATK